MRCEGHERELPTGIFCVAVTNETHGYNGWTSSFQLQGDAISAVLRAVDEGTLLCIGFVAANLEIRIGRHTHRNAHHAAQQEHGAEAQ